ncbi:PHD finger protein 14-like isoform X2 [Dreissena polymorpha]|uniref:PHD finger protein 14-like isoform X2 n=1 Tax=Dreissena polymorpha TaxID=45954 RepID=UPI002263F740|nr:PHD finger protein 14-like isoform X2 [Dreissena polymorpha]
MMGQDSLNAKIMALRSRLPGTRDPGKRRVKPVSRHLMQVNLGGDDSDNDSDYQVNNSDMSEDQEDDKDSSKHDSNNDGSDGGKEEDKVSESSNDDTDEEEGEESSDDDDDGDDSDDEASDENFGKPKRNYFDCINSDDDDDDEDYVPKKKQKQSSKGIQKHAEKMRIRSPEVKKVLNETNAEDSSSSRPMKVLICCICLGDISEADDEIVECDNCGVAVHEGCYGISDSQSTASTDSSASTEPWFCDACKAGVKPDCELCPNEGGIFKETDAGKWVHLVCALYTPGVAFGDVDKLSPVTLFEMPYSKWGLRECSLCEDSRFSRTGVCISCDAGMCRSFFHVTCAQRNGLLSEASPDEDIADPFYAYCKLHADKMTSRAKRRNYLAIQSHMKHHADNVEKQEEKEKARFRRKLMRHRQKYSISKAARPPSWVPPQKLVRFLTSSPSVVKKMLRKAELMGLITQSTHVVHTTEKQQERKKSHNGPALSAEFVTYYLDRNVRLDKIKADLKELEKQNEKLRKQDSALRQQYDQLLKGKTSEDAHRLRDEGQNLWSLLSDMSKKPLPLPEVFKKKKEVCRPATNMEVLKSPTAVIRQCGKCGLSHDQHLLAKCDTCHLSYHLACLEPPLTRMPKKTRIYSWQCSDCAKSSSDECEDTSTRNMNAPRRLRDKIKEPAKFSHAQQEMEFLFPSRTKKKSKRKLPKKDANKSSTNKRTAKSKIQDPEKAAAESDEQSDDESVYEPDMTNSMGDSPIDGTTGDSPIHHMMGYSPDEEEPGNSPPVGSQDGEELSDESSRGVEIHIEEETTPIYKQRIIHDISSVSRTGRRIIRKKHYDDESEMSDVSPTQNSSGGKRASSEQVVSRRSASKTPPEKHEKQPGNQCATCSKFGDGKTMVSCDNCELWYHFQCLDPPAKKTPKQRGYTWFCEACDMDDDSGNLENASTVGIKPMISRSLSGDHTHNAMLTF